MRFTVVCVSLLTIAACHESHRRDPDAMSVTQALDAGRALDGKHVKVAAIVHATFSVTSEQHREPSWGIQLVGGEDDYRAHRDHTLTCTVAGKPDVHLNDRVTAEGTARIGASGHVDELVPCTLR